MRRRRGRTGLLAGWRPSLRMAWRDALRAKGRSVLVLVMIALPVLAVTAADVVISTADVSGAEALERRLGAADARIQVSPGQGRVVQDFDPDEGMGSWAQGRSRDTPALEDVKGLLGGDVRAIELAHGWAKVETDKGRTDVELTEVELADPLATGLFELTDGSWPESTDEVVVNAALAGRGPGLGEDLVLGDGTTRTVVGLAEHAAYVGYEHAAGLPGAFELTRQKGQHTWLVEAGEVTWTEVRALNGIGATVLSRAVVSDPPPRSELDPELQSWDTGLDEATIAVAVLVVVMALLEVVLLAGPAFAVSARRQSRTLALMAASGGTPAQARRVVLAGGVVLGGVAALLGVLLGIGAGWAALPVVQRFDNSRFGPLDVPWPHLAGIAAFGLVSAVLAAVVPAWIASRQDVVAVLAGRRGDRAPSLRSPVLGAVLLAAGVGGAVYGATAGGMGGAYFIAGAAVVAVLGMILLVPLVVVGLARLCGRLPLVLRYAVRDAARHRTRTVPAVAAVAATVAGVVALGIAVSSDEAQNEATYVASLPIGSGVVSHYGRNPDWDGYADLVAREMPATTVTPVTGIRENHGKHGYVYLGFNVPGDPVSPLSGWGSVLGSSTLVGEGSVPPVLAYLDLDAPDVERTLARGGVVVFADHDIDADEVVVRVERDRGKSERPELSRVRLPATYVDLGATMSGPQAVVSPQAVERLGVEAATVGLYLTGAALTETAERDASEALAAVSNSAGMYVERGYQADDETVVTLLVLGALGAVLMLGGTLTATFLALSDARPDLATLSAVGASPRARRGVAAAYAVVVGLVGAALGAVVGFIPGVAITYPLTGESWMNDVDPSLPSHYLDVPWLLIGALVLALPLLTAVVVGLTARSRLPLVARLD